MSEKMELLGKKLHNLLVDFCRDNQVDKVWGWDDGSIIFWIKETKEEGQIEQVLITDTKENDK